MKRPLLIALSMLMLSTALFSGYQLWSYAADERGTDEQFDNLSARVEQPSPSEQEQGEPTPEWTVYDQYGLLFDQNTDMIGWITIEGTDINYPVMQTPDRPNYYINHTFEKNRSDHGVPYAAEGSKLDPQSDNIIIYGHNMKSGRMFGTLDNYKSESHFRKYPTIRFDTLAGFGTYEIIAVFKTTPDKFPYHLFLSTENKKEFDDYVDRCLELSLYDTEIGAEYGDKLITLSTCENSLSNGRLVVVAKKVIETSEQESIAAARQLLNVRHMPLLSYRGMCILPLRNGR